MTKIESIKFSKIILNWYDFNARKLPWRIEPKKSKEGILVNPYYTLVSEFMLQQTSVKTVIPYFKKFIKKWPSIETLSNASEDEVLSEWAGLGYYSRARNLIKCSIILKEKFNNTLPSNLDYLQKLPGIGPYTAAAIRSIAFNKPAVVIDGNVERVISRLFCVEKPIKSSKKLIYHLTDQVTCKKRPGDFAQALMDIGAMICNSKKPKCQICPLLKNCKAYKNNLTSLIPQKEKRKKNPIRYGYAFFCIFKKEYLILEKRPENGLLGGMTSLPTSDWKEKIEKINIPEFFKNNHVMKGEINHSFSHFDLKLKVLVIETSQLPKNMKIQKISELDVKNFPKIFQKTIIHALNSDYLKNFKN